MRHTADATCVSNWMLLREALSSQNAPFANLLRSGPGGRAGVAFSSFFSSRLAAAPVKMARATGVNFDVVGRANPARAAERGRSLMRTFRRVPSGSEPGAQAYHAASNYSSRRPAPKTRP